MGSEAKSITNWLVDLDFLGLWIPGMLFVILELVYIALCQGSPTFFKECMGIEYLIPFLVVSYVMGCALQSLRIMMRLKLSYPLKRPSSGVKKDNFFCNSEWTIHKQLKEEFVNDLHAQEVSETSGDSEPAMTSADSGDSEPAITSETVGTNKVSDEDKMVVNFYEAFLQQTEIGGFERSFRLMSLISLDYQTALALFLSAFLGAIQLILVIVFPSVKAFYCVNAGNPQSSYVIVLMITSILTGFLLLRRADWFTRYRTRFICRQVFMHVWRNKHNNADDNH